MAAPSWCGCSNRARRLRAAITEARPLAKMNENGGNALVFERQWGSCSATSQACCAAWFFIFVPLAVAGVAVLVAAFVPMQTTVALQQVDKTITQEQVVYLLPAINYQNMNNMMRNSFGVDLDAETWCSFAPADVLCAHADEVAANVATRVQEIWTSPIRSPVTADDKVDQISLAAQDDHDVPEVVQATEDIVAEQRPPPEGEDHLDTTTRHSTPWRRTSRIAIKLVVLLSAFGLLVFVFLFAVSLVRGLFVQRKEELVVELLLRPSSAPQDDKHEGQQQKNGGSDENVILHQDGEDELLPLARVRARRWIGSRLFRICVKDRSSTIYTPEDVLIAEGMTLFHVEPFLAIRTRDNQEAGRDRLEAEGGGGRASGADNKKLNYLARERDASRSRGVVKESTKKLARRRSEHTTIVPFSPPINAADLVGCAASIRSRLQVLQQKRRRTFTTPVGTIVPAELSGFVSS